MQFRFAPDFERMVHAGLEGLGEWHKTTGPACKPVANWCYSASRKKPCRIRISPNAVSSFDGVESIYDWAASEVHDFENCPEDTEESSAIRLRFGMTKPVQTSDAARASFLENSQL